MAARSGSILSGRLRFEGCGFMVQGRFLGGGQCLPPGNLDTGCWGEVLKMDVGKIQCLSISSLGVSGGVVSASRGSEAPSGPGRA